MVVLCKASLATGGMLSPLLLMVYGIPVMR